jgi:hypothetical protein
VGQWTDGGGGAAKALAASEASRVTINGSLFMQKLL